MNKELNENELNNIRFFSQSLGTLFQQIGIYSIIQIIVGIIIAVGSMATIASTITYPSPSEILNTFESTVWFILIASLILEVISYFFIIKIIKLLKDAEKQGIRYQDNYHKSALFFMAGIILGVIFLVMAIIIATWILGLIREIINDPSFVIENLNQIPSTDIISAFVEAGRISLSIAGFYYLKKNYKQLYVYIEHGERIINGFDFLLAGYIILILSNFIGLIVAFANLLGFVCLILIIVGYFKTYDRLTTMRWKT